MLPELAFMRDSFLAVSRVLRLQSRMAFLLAPLRGFELGAFAPASLWDCTCALPVLLLLAFSPVVTTADVADPLQLISDRQHQSTLRWRETHLLTRGKSAHPCTLPNRPMLNALACRAVGDQQQFRLPPAHRSSPTSESPFTWPLPPALDLPPTDEFLPDEASPCWIWAQQQPSIPAAVSAATAAAAQSGSAPAMATAVATQATWETTPAANCGAANGFRPTADAAVPAASASHCASSGVSFPATPASPSSASAPAATTTLPPPASAGSAVPAPSPPSLPVAQLEELLLDDCGVLEISIPQRRFPSSFPPSFLSSAATGSLASTLPTAGTLPSAGTPSAATPADLREQGLNLFASLLPLLYTPRCAATAAIAASPAGEKLKRALASSPAAAGMFEAFANRPQPSPAPLASPMLFEQFQQQMQQWPAPQVEQQEQSEPQVSESIAAPQTDEDMDEALPEIESPNSVDVTSPHRDFDDSGLDEPPSSAAAAAAAATGPAAAVPAPASVAPVPFAPANPTVENAAASASVPLDAPAATIAAKLEPVSTEEAGTAAASPAAPAAEPLDDGYFWRKYGQKAAKGAAYPRAYFRCAVPRCPAKKTVERSSEDGSTMEIVYREEHNHPRGTLPGRRASPASQGGAGGARVLVTEDMGGFGSGGSGIPPSPVKPHQAQPQQQQAQNQVPSAASPAFPASADPAAASAAAGLALLESLSTEDLARLVSALSSDAMAAATAVLEAAVYSPADLAAAAVNATAVVTAATAAAEVARGHMIRSASDKGAPEAAAGLAAGSADAGAVLFRSVSAPKEECDDQSSSGNTGGIAGFSSGALAAVAALTRGSSLAVEPSTCSTGSAGSTGSRQKRRSMEEIDTTFSPSSPSLHSAKDGQTVTMTVVQVEGTGRDVVGDVEDGYRWRKYGQKAIKASPYERSYFRCSKDGCGARRVIERCPEQPEDESVAATHTNLLVTYIGVHSHARPFRAKVIYKPVSDASQEPPSEEKPSADVAQTGLTEAEAGGNADASGDATWVAGGSGAAADMQMAMPHLRDLKIEDFGDLPTLW
ncbi:unnamed protein product [Closterium sp. Yama58-4]|nr:unnamed protein product [Closterium sp. Yama58-4]